MTPELTTTASPWPPRVAALAVGVGVVLLLGLFVWALGRQSGVGQVPVANRPAPDFDLRLFGQSPGSTGHWSLSAQSGRPVVVNFWASWCIPCEDEAPVLEQLSRRYSGRVAFVGVDVQDSDNDARAFLARYGISYPNGPDSGGAISIDYGMSGVPETYFVGPDQRIARKWAGPLDETRLTSFVEDLLR